MKKSFLSKGILGLLVVIGWSTTMTSATYFNFGPWSSTDSIKNNFTLVHFTLPTNQSNDYQGAFFWQQSSSFATPIKVNAGSAGSRDCTKQVKGLYYSNAKGSRLLPLDEQTLQGLRLLNADYNTLTVNGGIYTTCALSGSNDIYSLYGMIEYAGGAGDAGIAGTKVIAGFGYDPLTNKVKTGASFTLLPSLQYFNNQTPLGYIYDSVGGVGFVGGRLSDIVHQYILGSITSQTGINQLFGFAGDNHTIGVVSCPAGAVPADCIVTSSGYLGGLNTLWGVGVVGNILLGRGGLDATNRQSVFGNPNQTSAVVFSDVVNTSDILNTLRKNASNLCRGRELYETNRLAGNSASAGEETICINNGESDGGTYNDLADPLIIDLTDEASYEGKEIIVKGRNVILEGSMQSTGAALNLFVDNGNVLLDGGSATAPSTYQMFNANGNMTGGPALSFANTGVNYGVYIRGNIFVNGLIIGNPTSFGGTLSTALKYYVHGRIASLNTALPPSSPRKDLIDNIFVSAAYSYGDYINWSNVFTWSCQLNGTTNASTVTTIIPCAVPNDRFKDNPLVIIATPIPTVLYQ